MTMMAKAAVAVYEQAVGALREASEMSLGQAEFTHRAVTAEVDRVGGAAPARKE
jgi:hypothetical protein